MKRVLTGLILLSLFGGAKEIGPKSFYRVISQKRVTVVKFWASWCAPCSILNGEFKNAKRRLGKKVLFAEYNVDLGGKPLRDYKVEYIPTMIIFKNGKELSRTTSILSSGEIIDWVNSFR